MSGLFIFEQSMTRNCSELPLFPVVAKFFHGRWLGNLCFACLSIVKVRRKMLSLMLHVRLGNTLRGAEDVATLPFPFLYIRGHGVPFLYSEFIHPLNCLICYILLAQFSADLLRKPGKRASIYRSLAGFLFNALINSLLYLKIVWICSWKIWNICFLRLWAPYAWLVWAAVKPLLAVQLVQVVLIVPWPIRLARRYLTVGFIISKPTPASWLAILVVMPQVSKQKRNAWLASVMSKKSV